MTNNMPPSHGGNRGSNPLGSANKISYLKALPHRKNPLVENLWYPETGSARNSAETAIFRKEVT